LSRRSWQCLVGAVAVLALSTPSAFAAEVAGPADSAEPAGAAAIGSATASATPSVTPSAAPGTTAVAEPTAGASTEPEAGSSGSADSEAAGPTTTPTAAPTTSPTAVVPSTDASSAGATRTTSAAATTCVNNPQIALGATAVALGGTIRVTGTGWCNNAAGGSILAFKLDAGGVARVSGILNDIPTIWAIVEADADGSVDAEITLPDGTAATSTPKQVVGGPHSFTILTGSLKTGDPIRSMVTSSFDYLARGTSADDPDVWGYPLTGGTAKAWVQRSVSTADGTVRIAGTGWKASGGAPSTIAVKLNASDSTQFERTSDLEESDSTIWSMGRAAVTGTHQFKVAADGSFDVELDLPAGLTTGQYLSVRLATGKFGTGDVQRSVLSPLLAVDGTAYSAPDEGADVVCRPTTTATTATVLTPTVKLGGTLVLAGTGWCHPTGGASRIGVKIDDGAYSHLDSHVHSNRTIWAIIQADHRTGTFTASIALPDGTTATSVPALTNGAHTLRLLSGSLRAGDKIRSMDLDFVVGTYRPNGSPDPVGAAALTKAARHGMTAAITSAGRLRVTLPSSPSGTWVFLTAYVADGSPRYPWGERWYRLDARHGITVKVPADVPAGALKVVAQSGDQGKVGRVLGWRSVTLRSVVAVRTVATVASVVPVLAAPTLTLVVPALPAATYAALATTARAGASATLAGRVVTLTLPKATPGEPVFLTVYSAGRSVQAGWVTPDAARRVKVDLTALGTGAFRISAQGADGALLGWVPLKVGVDQVATAAVPASDAPGAGEATDAGTTTGASRSSATSEASFVSATDGWLLGLGAVVLAGTGLTIRLRKAGA
jgi:hypothetical protein